MDPKEMFPWPAEFKLDKKGRYLGKSPKQWREMARQLYADSLLRASNVGGGVVGTMVTTRILGILAKEDPEMLQRTVETRDRCLANMNLFVASFALTSAERQAADKRKKKAKKKC